jgi:alkanesulfonate monooxygenase SsuD/methylene tetrahydromethanopterin reductase-like flavin-dependent oxidoreductase (luciferase family)
LGLEGVFSIELSSNPWIPLAAAATSTSTLRLASGIALSLVRSPFDTAIAALDLDRLSEGRFTLGLGTSIRRLHDDYYGATYDPPVARISEAVQLIKAIVSGRARALGRFDGEFHHLDFSRLEMLPPLRPDLPIWIGALRAPLVRVAGQHADGLMGHPSWSVRWAIEQVNGPFAQGLARSGRTRGDVSINLWHTVAPNPDDRQSVHDAKRHVARYASISQYQGYFAANGFGPEAQQIFDRTAAGGDAADLVPDEMARTFVVCGTPDSVRAQLQPALDIADSLCLQPPPAPREQRLAYEAQIKETFYS